MTWGTSQERVISGAEKALFLFRTSLCIPA